MVGMSEHTAHVERVTNDHADALDSSDAAAENSRRRVGGQSTEAASMKAIVAKADEEAKSAIEKNDLKLKEDVVGSANAVWDFLGHNHVGVMQLYREGDATVEKATDGLGDLKLQTDEAKTKLDQGQADEGTRPSQVAAGPGRIVPIGSRDDLRKLDDKVEGARAQMDVTRAEANVAATAAGAAIHSGPSAIADGMGSSTQACLLEDATGAGSQ